MKKKLSRDLKRLEKEINELEEHYEIKENRLYRALQSTIHEYLVETIIDEVVGGVSLDEILKIDEGLAFDVLEEVKA